MPARLREVGMHAEDIPALADALADVCAGGNPREATRDEVIALYIKAY
ncbi:hypothetical protein [Microbispora bryophytorum]